MSRHRIRPLTPNPALIRHAEERAANLQKPHRGPNHCIRGVHALRADEKRQVIAAEEWRSVQLEEKQNEQLLTLSRQILQLTDEIHRLTVSHTTDPGPAVGARETPSPS